MVFEFLGPKELPLALKNAHHALKEKGVLFFITTHPDKMKATSGLEKPGPFIVQFPWGGEGPNYYRTREDFIKAVKEAGFNVENIEDLNLSLEAKKQDSAEYTRYHQYPNTRLTIKATKI